MVSDEWDQDNNGWCIVVTNFFYQLRDMSNEADVPEDHWWGMVSDEWDQDNNGRLNLDEFDRLWKDFFGEESNGSSMHGLYDSNGNGNITGEEWKGLTTQLMDMCSS